MLTGGVEIKVNGNKDTWLLNASIAYRASGIAAVGDGANDIIMMHPADVAIAYRGKPVLNEAAAYQVINLETAAQIIKQNLRSRRTPL